MTMRKEMETMRPWQRRLVTLTLTGMLIAVYFILDRLLTFYPVPSVKVGFAFLPVIAAAIWLGPVSAALVGGLGDLLGSLLMPAGTPMPLLTVSAALEGLILGLLLFERAGVVRRWGNRWLRLIGGTVGVSVLLHLLFNTFSLAVLFSPDAVWVYMLGALPLRAAKEAVLLAVEIPMGAALFASRK